MVSGTQTKKKLNTKLKEEEGHKKGRKKWDPDKEKQP